MHERIWLTPRRLLPNLTAGVSVVVQGDTSVRSAVDEQDTLSRFPSKGSNDGETLNEQVFNRTSAEPSTHTSEVPSSSSARRLPEPTVPEVSDAPDLASNLAASSSIATIKSNAVAGEITKPPKVVKGTLKAGVVVYVAGYNIPLEAPIAALHEYFKAPDCFLYVVVCMP